MASNLVLKGPSNVNLQVHLGVKSCFLVLVLVRGGFASGDGGVKYLASSLTLVGPILLLGWS